MRQGRIVTDKSVEQLTADFEAVTVMKRDLRTLNKDAREKSFYLDEKTEQYYFLHPSPKISGVRSALYTTHVLLKISENESGSGSVVEYGIFQQRIAAIIGIATILFLGILIALNADMPQSLYIMLLFAIMALIGGAASFWAIKSSCDKTEKEILRVIKENRIYEV